MTISTGNFYGKGGVVVKKHFDTVGIDTKLGMSIKAIQKKLSACPNQTENFEQFCIDYVKASEEVDAIGKKWLKRITDAPNGFFKGCSYVNYDIMSGGGYRFWFDVDNSDYVI